MFCKIGCFSWISIYIYEILPFVCMFITNIFYITCNIERKKTIVSWELLTTTSSLSKVQFEVF